jgi:hypothetical protein
MSDETANSRHEGGGRRRDVARAIQSSPVGIKPLNPPAGAAATESANAGRTTAAAAGTARPAGAATARTADPRPAAACGLRPFETASWEVASDEYVAHLLATMGALVDVSDRSLREVERVLSAHGCGLDIHRLLSGKFRIKVHQFLDVCRAIDVHPIEVFRLVLGEPRRPSALVERTVALFGGTDRPTLRVPARAEDTSQLTAIEHRLDRLQRLVEDLWLRNAGVSIGEVHDTPTPAGRDGSGIGEDLALLADTVRRLRIRAGAATLPATGRGRR